MAYRGTIPVNSALIAFSRSQMSAESELNAKCGVLFLFSQFLLLARDVTAIMGLNFHGSRMDSVNGWEILSEIRRDCRSAMRRREIDYFVE